MAKNCGKIVLLLIPCLATTCLLSYCLLSDAWVTTNTAQLANITQLFEAQFEAFANGSPKVHVVSLSSDQRRVKLSTTSTTTSTTTTSTTSKSSTSNDLHGNVDYTDEEYTDEGTGSASDANYVKKKLKRRSLMGKNENLFHSKLNDDRKFKAKNNDDDTDVDEADDVDNESESVKHNKMNVADYEQHQPNSINQQQHRIDYIYVTKLWPMVKSKSLYSDCVEYHKLKLKISLGYLTMDKKEPIGGQLHYYDNAAYFTDENNPAGSCSKKSMVYCQFTKTCKQGKSCDGVVDCEDQSDEQMCTDDRVCSFNNDITGFKCDNKCWQYWNKCDFTPHCFDMSDELASECEHHTGDLSLTNSSNSNSAKKISSSMTSTLTGGAFSFFNHDHSTFTFGRNHYDRRRGCFRDYFNFKSAKLIKKDTLKYLSQQLADNVQETNNLNYHLQLIYTLSFLASLLFCLLALLSIAFILCFGKLCFQCPFWFFGFFQILAWLTALSGVMTFLYQFYASKQKSMDPLVQLPIHSEVMRLNGQLLEIEQLGLSFWLACGATLTSFLGSFMSCIICCRLPSSRHEDKEYKIMQLPTYS